MRGLGDVKAVRTYTTHIIYGPILSFNEDACIIKGGWMRREVHIQLGCMYMGWTMFGQLCVGASPIIYN